MLMSDPSYSLWSIWMYLPTLHRLYLLVLSRVGIYSLYSLKVVMVRLRTLNKRQVGVASLQHSTAALQGRCKNVQELLGACFYLFGLVFLIGLRFVPMNLSMSSKPPTVMLMLNECFIYFAFAANVFVMFMILHCMRWFVSGRLVANIAAVSAYREPR